MTARNAAGTSNRESSSRNSVIVISDSETADGDNDSETGDNDKNDTSVIECTKPSLSSRGKRKSKTPAKQNTDRSSIIPLDNDSSILYLSERESLLNEENIGESTPLGSLYKKRIRLKESVDLMLF